MQFAKAAMRLAEAAAFQQQVAASALLVLAGSSAVRVGAREETPEGQRCSARV